MKEPIISEIAEKYFNDAWLSYYIKNNPCVKIIHYDIDYDVDDKFISSAKHRYRLYKKKLYEDELESYLSQRILWSDMLRKRIRDGHDHSFVSEQIRENEEKIRSTRRRIDFLSRPHADCKNMDIAVAKQIPIDSLFEVLPNGFFINNPLREERSPSNSFHLNRQKNIWCDYGTGEHGDILDLIMKINKCDLKTAYNIIVKY